MAPSAEPRPVPRTHDAGIWAQRLYRRLGGIPVTIAILLLASVAVAPLINPLGCLGGASVRQTTDDAYVRSDITPLGAKIEG